MRLLVRLASLLVGLVALGLLIIFMVEPTALRRFLPPAPIAVEPPTATATPMAPTQPEATPLPSPTPTVAVTPVVRVVPYGSETENGQLIATPTPEIPLTTSEELTRQYGDRPFASVEAMPAEMRVLFTQTVGEVAEFFGVEAEALVALLRAQNGGELRIATAMDGEVIGVAGLPPQLWNGIANPWTEGYARDTRIIDQYGGLGFDWSGRYAWRVWADGRMTTGSPVIARGANPATFENGVAALGRYLVGRGITSALARRNAEAHETRLGQAIIDLQSEGMVAAPSVHAVAAPLPSNVALRPLRDEYARLLENTFAASLSESALEADLSRHPEITDEVLAGTLSVAEGAKALLTATTQRYLVECLGAQADRRPLPWPFITDEQTLAAQQLAVQRVGHTLPAWELQGLISRAEGDPVEMVALLEQREEARVFAQARELLDTKLQRSARGLPISVVEVSRIVQPALAPRAYTFLGSSALREILGDVEHYLRRMPEFVALNGDMLFDAQPFVPMPTAIIQPFGVRVSYQPGVHTGVDLRGRRANGQEPLIYAVDAGTVVHVGPIYCDEPRLCRGRNAVVIDHGNQRYSLYSHNSAAYVKPGDVVTAGQEIARQGNEGYSRGPHLHLEVHVGAPWSGDWTHPFYGGEFVDPMPWLPRR